MNLSPGILISGLVIGSAGLGLFLYGKKNSNGKCLIAGVAMCALPYFAHSVVLMWLLAGACAAGLYGFSKWV